MRSIKSDKIKSFFKEKLNQIKLNEILIESTISSLVEASLFGIDSHGVNLFGHYYDCLLNGRIQKGTELDIKVMGSCITCDAKNNLANFAAKTVLTELDLLTKKNGIAIASIKNCDHIGAVGIHGVNSQIKNKLIFGFTNADALAVTPDGENVIFGTNPISLIFKSTENFLYIDLATTKFSMNKVKNYRRENKELPQDFARDQYLRKTVDPNAASYLEPIGNHKGFALAYLVEIMTSGLSGQNHSYDLMPMYGTNLKKQRGVSHSFIMIDPSFFNNASLDSINKKISITNKNVTEFQSKQTPGNKEINTKLKRLEKGIPISDPILEQWIKLGFKDD